MTSGMRRRGSRTTNLEEVTVRPVDRSVAVSYVAALLDSRAGEGRESEGESRGGGTASASRPFTPVEFGRLPSPSELST